ncbi:MAG TPA: hypothetical protein VHK22_08470 [Gaiellaceae bacterium]|jgi:hypothetical protein|nr:hypothetical protein [Gaiellaceae bacterium]
MDLNLYFRVIWRFKVIAAAGLLLALVLAFLSYATVRFDGIPPSVGYRQTEQWESLATIGVASPSFEPGSILTPETRGLLNPPQADGGSGDGTEAAGKLDPADLTSFPRLNEITVQAMALATSDAVKRIIEKGGPVKGGLQTFPVSAGDSLVPFITFSAIAPTPEDAVSLNKRHVAAFKKFFGDRQAAAGIPSEERVVIETVNAPQAATLLEGRKKTRPIIVLLTVMTAVLGLCFVLENLRPRVREVTPGPEALPTNARAQSQAQPRRRTHSRSA